MSTPAHSVADSLSKKHYTSIDHTRDELSMLQVHGRRVRNGRPWIPRPARRKPVARKTRQDVSSALTLNTERMRARSVQAATCSTRARRFLFHVIKESDQPTPNGYPEEAYSAGAIRPRLHKEATVSSSQVRAAFKGGDRSYHCTQVYILQS